MSDPNPFAFLLEKPRRSLDREFYSKADTFEDLDDPMWLYLLNLVPNRGASHANKVARMLRTISPQLKTYYMVRQFTGEWGSGGMESIFFDDKDWRKWIPEAIQAFRSLAAIKHAALIETVVSCTEKAEQSQSESDLERWSIKFKRFDREWEKLDELEKVFDVIYEDIKRDCTPYLHPTGP